MKKTNILLPALLALVCLFAVSCDSEPANPENPANPGKPDDQPVTPPSIEDSEIEQGISAYNQIANFCSLMFMISDQTKSAFENDGKTAFLELLQDDKGEYCEDGKEALLYLAFAQKGKVDHLGDHPYIEVEGKRRLFLPATGNWPDEIKSFEIEEMDVDSVSFRLEEDANGSGICHIEFANLSFTVKITDPVVDYRIPVRISLNVSAAVQKDEDSSVGCWMHNPYEGLELDATVDGSSWPHYERHFVESALSDIYYICKYGDYERTGGYTISFDSNGGSSVDPIIVGFGDSIDTSNLPIPTKEDYPFKEWLTEDGEPVNEYFNLTEDITLYACYFDEESPSSLEGEIFSMYKLACLIKENALEKSSAGGERPKIQELFSSETVSKALFDMLLFLNGETDSFGSKSYITIGEKQYDEDFSSSHTFADGAIGGGGRASYSDNSENSTKPTYKRLKLDDLSYYVIIDSNVVRVDNFYADLETWYEEGSDEYYAIALTIKDRSVEEVSHSFKLFRNTNKGVYDDYYFDSTRYNQTT